MPWTVEELAEMARADAEIEAEFEDEATAYRLARENAEYAEEIDRTARADSLPRSEVNRRRKIAAYQKAYREANREEIAAYQKAYREANREEIAARNKAYREANREINGPCDALRAYRKEHGYTQRDLARLLGVSQSLICNYEKGKIPFDMSTLDDLMAAAAAAAKEKERSCGNTNAQNE